MRKEDAFKVLGLSGTVSMKDITKAYRKLASKYHPDRNPQGETMMKMINAAYEALGKLDYSENINTGESTASDYLKEIAESLGVISTLDNITVELCGSWLWVTGDTKPVKDQLKELGFKWHSQKVCWYKCPPNEKRKFYGKKNTDLEDIRTKYGSDIIKGEKAKRVSKRV